MPCDIAVRCSQLSKYYPIYRQPSDRLRQWLWGARRQYYREFWAVRDLSLEIKRGEVVGILGKNGSGKSTLLQMICGCVTPSSGELVTQGRIAALLELGSGFNPEFSGLENVHLNATILGLSRREIEQRLDEILAFADIGEFIHQPVKSYSSGMAMRLAFAVAATIDPDILIVDEALAVGDIQFQAKCFRHFNQLIARGTTIIFVTHSTEQVVRHCSKAFLMEAGSIVESGDPRVVVNHYLDRMLGPKEAMAEPEAAGKPAGGESASSASPLARQQQMIPFEQQAGYNPSEYRWGNRSAMIQAFHLTKSGESAHQTHFNSGDQLSVSLKIYFLQECRRPIFSFRIKTPDGITVYGNNSRDCSRLKPIIPITAGVTVMVTFKLALWLSQGDYLLSFGIATDETGEVIPLDRRYDAAHITLLNDYNGFGLAELQMKYSIIEYYKDQLE